MVITYFTAFLTLVVEIGAVCKLAVFVVAKYKPLMAMGLDLAFFGYLPLG